MCLHPLKRVEFMCIEKTKSIYILSPIYLCMNSNSTFAVSVDLDDTLIPTHFLFENAKDKFVTLIQSEVEEDVSASEILEVLEQIDLEHHESMGITKDRFALSMLEASRELLNEPSDVVKNEAFEIGMSPIKSVEEYQNIGVLDGYSEFCAMVEEVKDHSELVTVGDREVQYNKIEAFNLRDKFDTVSVVDSGHKSDPLTRMKEEYDIVVHIGNSLKSDIKPADELGISAIYVDNSDWLGDYTPQNEDSTIYSVDSLVEAKDKLHEIAP